MSLAADSAFALPRRASAFRWGVWLAFPAYAALLALAWFWLSRTLPDQFALHLVGHSIAIGHVHDRLLGDAALALSLAPAVLWLECVFIGWQASSARALLRPSRSARTDLAAFLMEHLHLAGLVGKLMTLGLSVISGAALRIWLAAHTGLSADISALSFLLQVPLCFLAYTFFDYWAHRIGHTRLFWPLHRYHHAAEEMVVINGGRLHPAGFVTLFVVNLPLSLLGADAQAVFGANLIAGLLGLLIHSRLETDFGWIGRHVVQSPRHHRLHHKLDMDQPTGFFGMAPIWDHLFGGWSERAERNIAIGVDTTYRHGFWVLPDMLRDYRDFWLGLVGRRPLSPSERTAVTKSR
jgi:sterol desaturase/sphingolipid hydroxylase (fatty acid hydroxylase superfamily)